MSHPHSHGPAHHEHRHQQGHQHQPQHGHQHGHQPQHQHPAEDDAAQAEVLDLDAEVLAGHLAAITDWLPLDAEPRRIVDLGAGTGAGAFALLRRFPDAEVTAVDASPGHLLRLREKAGALGLDDRITTVQADLDAADWPDLGAPDLVWASASLHHLADPGRALRAIRALLAPDGVFALVELAGFPRFLPADAPADRPGLEERCHAATDHLHAEHVPHRGADWGPLLTAAGLTVTGERTVAVDIAATEHPSVGRYALATLRRIRTAAAEHLDPADLAALDRLLDADGPGSVALRPDLAVRTERQVWAARR
ncbi:class I SAM-dependent methyltransferase [Kitasatospora sp. NA04385]|uniref:class I SAM-dependent methyltransferase n=1 Tax=Kitasatospora sp. NA04385 TaxID=2742135 RepID=UPI0015904F76|nr:class I SAM-dependent methyltransferase [Kitasatospora sp. NA04385]QKW23419.1 class I SAM-dependent methyltransferase [Kitasatospora sp. NA04385]